MSPRRIGFLAIGAAFAGVGTLWFFRAPRTVESPVAEASRRLPAPPRLEGDPEPPAVVFPMADGGTLALAMDEVCVRDAEGVETILKLEPPANPGSYRARTKGFSGRGEVLPVAYPEGEERSEANRRIVTKQLRVKMPQVRVEAVAGRNRLAVAERPDYAPEWVILEAADPLAALAAVDGVRRSDGVAEADVLVGRKRFARAMPNDALITSQWHLKNATVSPSITHANVEAAWAYPTFGAGVRGRGIRIGIVDDGLQTAHPDLSANVDTANDWDWNGNDNDPNPAVSGDNHGTNCAGVAGARGNNGIGVAGVAPESTLVGMRLIGNNASPTDLQESGAMDHRNDIIQVKSNSWGPVDSGNLLEGPGPLTRSAFETAVTSGRGGKGTIFVWAGGNGKTTGDNSNYDGYANSIYTIAVSASNSNGASSHYSEPGANLLVAAPSGGNGASLITTTDRTGTAGRVNGDYYTAFTGTSSATPVVSGVVALMLEKNATLGWRDVQEILVRSATKVAPSDAGWKTNGAGFSFNHQFGAGLVNASAAVDLANGWTNLPPQGSVSSTQTGTVAIPENNATGVTKVFSFPQVNHRVEHATVSLQATHSARGNLRITLTSPSGMESVLADVHNDMNANYSWTFSSVHHWGESAFGTWTVKVADLSSIGNATGGTLGDVTLTLYGAEHTFPNYPPSVTAAALSVPGQAYVDEPPGVSSVTASDPEGSPVTLAYQWQSGTNGTDYTDAPGETAAQLSVAEAHAAKLWRCRITPHDGTDAGEPFFTAAVNVLARPGPFVRTGESYGYQSGLVLPYVGSPPLFRLGTGSVLPDGLSLDTGTGVISGTVLPAAAGGNHPITVERYNGSSSVSQTFTLRVFPGSYAEWIGGFTVNSAEQPVDDDGDGLPNLVEYLLDLDPARREDEPPVVFSDEGGELSLTFRESKLPADATLDAEWSTSLGTGAIWQTSGITRTVLEEDAFSRLVRASLEISPSDEKRFLRLKAETTGP